jgi:thioredoxin 1
MNAIASSVRQDAPLVGDADFDREVLESPVPVLVDFGAAWCGPCRALEPVIEGIARDHGSTIRVRRVDADEATGVAARYRVRGLPTVIAFSGGKEIGRHVGMTNAAVLLRLFGEQAR